MKKCLSLAVCLAALLACAEPPKSNTSMLSYMRGQVTQQQVPAQQRIKIEQIGAFNDYLAYGGMRGIYIITDQKTGKEFIGISGIGISEIGFHSTDGITTIHDER